MLPPAWPLLHLRRHRGRPASRWRSCHCRWRIIIAPRQEGRLTLLTAIDAFLKKNNRRTDREYGNAAGLVGRRRFP